MPRQMQRHGRWLILACLLATCIFVIFCTPGRHVLRVSPLHYAETHRSGVPIPGSVVNKPTGHRGGSWRRPGANSPALTLSSAEELAVVTAYLAALPENRIPTVVDPKTKLDPQLVLDFDTRAPSAREEVAEVVHDAWHRNPVVIYGKSYNQDSREIEAILDKLNLLPGPTVFHVNDRPDGEILEPLIFRLTNATALPLVLIGGTPRGGLRELKNLSADGTLPKLIEIAGAKIDGKKKKGGRKH